MQVWISYSYQKEGKNWFPLLQELAHEFGIGGEGAEEKEESERTAHCHFCHL